MKKLNMLLLAFWYCMVPLSAADQQPNDVYNYAAALSQFKADNAAEVNKTVEDWDGTRTMTLVYKLGPEIRDGNVVGAHVIMQKKVFNDKSEHKGRTVEQSVSTWYSPENPGVYMSLAQLRAKYPQFEGKGTADKPDTAEVGRQMSVRMLEMKNNILDRRTRMIERIRRFSDDTGEMAKIFAIEKQRVAEKWAELKVPGSSGKGKLIFDPYTGEFTSDIVRSSAGEGVHIAQDELIVWEMENTRVAESDWLRANARFKEDEAAEQQEIERSVADYLVLKKAVAALERARQNKPMNGDDELVQKGMQLLNAGRK